MATRKTTIKNYKGYTFVFVPDRGRYKTSAKGFSTYWYQDNLSVIEAKRRMDNQ